jgi:RNA polymerase sigma-70 factor (ECF subfamily)
MSYLRLRPELLARFRSGDRDALAEVYRAYLPRIRGLLRHGFIVKASGLRVPGAATPDDLADAIQEVFTRAFKREARLAYDGLRDYAPYLTVIARNIIVSRHRRRGRELILIDPSVLTETDLFEPDLAPADAEPWLDARAVEIARRYVADLEEPMRGVHTARYVQALSQRDAARELGLSRPKVRKLEDRLRRGLAGLLARAGVQIEDSVQAEVRVADQNGPWTRRPRTS